MNYRRMIFMKYIYLDHIDKVFNDLVLVIKSSNFLSGNYNNFSDIVIMNQVDAIIFSTGQDVDYLKGQEYQYWTYILEEQDSVYNLLQSKNRFDGEVNVSI